MTSHAERAKTLFYEGYNCAQSVLLAFSDMTGLDDSTAMRLASSFGGGMGRMRETCGAVCAAFMVIGLLYGYDDPTAVIEKSEHYARIQEISRRFKSQNGSIICRELLGANGVDTSPTPSLRTAEYYKKRPCPDICAFAAGLVDQYIEENPLKYYR